jgi:arylsulfatase A-like enzyme
VPLIFAGSGIKAGVDTTGLVELIDLGATLCDLAGVEPHHLDQGRSLVPLLTGLANRHRESVYCEMGCDRMLFDGRYKLMRGDPLSDQRRLGRLHLDKPANIPASPARLYDLLEDPQEMRNIDADPSYREIRMMMQDKLLDRINENTQPLASKGRGVYRPVEC